MREVFEHELAGIRDLLIELAVKAGAAMNTATQAMLDADLITAQSVIAGDDELDDLTGRIELACYDAVARQRRWPGTCGSSCPRCRSPPPSSGWGTWQNTWRR